MTTYYVDIERGNDQWDGLAPAFVSGTNGPWRVPPGIPGNSYNSYTKSTISSGQELVFIGRNTPWRFANATVSATPFSTAYVNGITGATAPDSQWKKWSAYPGTTPVISSLTYINADGTVDYGPMSYNNPASTVVVPQPGNPTGGIWSLFSSTDNNFDVWKFDYSGASFTGVTRITYVTCVFDRGTGNGYLCVVTNSNAGFIQSQMYWADSTNHMLYVSVPKGAGIPTLKLGTTLNGLSGSSTLFMRGVGECIIDGFTIEGGAQLLSVSGYDASNVVRDLTLRNNLFIIPLGANLHDNNQVTCRAVNIYNQASTSSVSRVLIENNEFRCRHPNMYSFPASVYAAAPTNEPYADVLTLLSCNGCTIRNNKFYDAGHAFINATCDDVLGGGGHTIVDNYFDGTNTNYGYPLGASFTNLQTAPIVFKRNTMVNTRGAVQINCKGDALLPGTAYNVELSSNLWINKTQANKPTYACGAGFCINMGSFVSSGTYNFGYVGIFNNTVIGCDGPFILWQDGNASNLLPGPVTIMNNILVNMWRKTMVTGDPCVNYTNMYGPVIAVFAHWTGVASFVITTSNNLSALGRTGTNGGYTLPTGSATLTINGSSKAHTGSSDAALTAVDCGVISNADPGINPDGSLMIGSQAIAAAAYTGYATDVTKKQFYNLPSIGAYEAVRSRLPAAQTRTNRN